MRDTSRRHPMPMVMRARRLREAEWSYRKIAAMIGEEFDCPAPSDNTVAKWCNDAFADRERLRMRDLRRRERANAADFLLHHGTSPEYREAFMRRLKQDKMSANAISKVCGVVFGEPVSPRAVERVLKEQAA